MISSESAGLGGVFAAARCDALVNLASLGFGHAPGIMAAARTAGFSHAVFISTTAVTTRLPARTKQIRLDAERLIRESGMKWTILRPTMIYGAPGDRNLSRLLTLLHRVPLLPVPGGGGISSSRSTWRTWPARCSPPWNGPPPRTLSTTWPARRR